MDYVKGVLLAALLCLLCVFLPQGGMGTGADMGAGIRMGKEQMVELLSARMEKIRSLGITEADESMEEMIKAEWKDTSYGFFDGGENTEAAIDACIFQHIGGGKLDYKSWEWTPGSKQVYMFDVEVFDVGNMYTNFMKGILPLMDGEVSITDIEEDLSGVDMESGSGVQVLRFKCNGNPYEFRAEAYYDWMDMRVVDFMNGVLETEQAEKRLWVSSDGYQGCIIFFNTKEWAKEFRRIMGYGLSNEAD